METVNPTSVAEIRDWLTNAVASKLKISPDKIETDIPFDEYALESVAAVAISGDLGELMGRDLPGTLLYEYPTIDELSEHLVQSSQDAPGG